MLCSVDVIMLCRVDPLVVEELHHSGFPLVTGIHVWGGHDPPSDHTSVAMRRWVGELCSDSV